MSDFQFEKLQVYQLAVDFSHQVYLLTLDWPPKYQYNLADQFRRAALSISLNIAEGSSRSKKDFKHFLSISRGSCFESIPIIAIAQKQNIISNSQFNDFYNQILTISKMLTSLKNKI